MIQAESYYRHSGRFGLVGIVCMSVLGGVTGLVLGGLYGVISFVNPYIYLNFLLTCLTGAAAGWMTARGGRIGKVRSGGIAALWGGLAGLAALYANWVGWTCGWLNWETVLWSPADLWEAHLKSLRLDDPFHPRDTWSLMHSALSVGVNPVGMTLSDLAELDFTHRSSAPRSWSARTPQKLDVGEYGDIVVPEPPAADGGDQDA